MAEWKLVVNYQDIGLGRTSKTFYGDFDTYATAATKRTALLTDLQAASTAQIVSHSLSEEVVVGGAGDAGSNVFYRVSGTVVKDDGRRANMQFPSPEAAMLSGNALIVGAALWTDLMANFAAGEWEISDGEHYVSTVKGAKISVPSGKTNLP